MNSSWVNIVGLENINDEDYEDDGEELLPVTEDGEVDLEGLPESVAPEFQLTEEYEDEDE